MDRDVFLSRSRAVCTDAKTGRLLPPHRAGQALVYAFLKRQPYIMRP